MISPTKGNRTFFNGQGSGAAMSSAVIVVPCYNEAERLQIQTFKTFTCERHAARFLFVNDGSTDDTSKVLQELCTYDPHRFATFDLPRNVGKAEAVRVGLLHAFTAGTDYVGYWDADLATPLDAIPVFMDLLDARPDLMIVLGARVRLIGRSIERKAMRHYLGRIFATAASVALGMAIYDTQCGAKLLRVSPIIENLFQQPFATRWLFDVEILARLIHASRGPHLPAVQSIIYELPLQTWRDVAGSKVKPVDFLRAFFGLTHVYWKYLRPHARG
jgi:dolichyl-phosphate beta-glucosyltransferase